MSSLRLLLAILLFATTFAATFAAPSQLLKRVFYPITGVIPQGVNCATVNEPLHSLSADTLTTFIDVGISYANEQTRGQRLTRAEFDPSTQFNPHDHPVDWASGCDVAAGLYAYPVYYEGTCLPKIYMNTNQIPCDGPLTTDIVVFNVAFDGSRPVSARYCATLTHSDAPEDTKNLDAYTFAGYRQCMNNATPGS